MPQLRLIHIVITLSAAGVTLLLGMLGVTRLAGEFPSPAPFEWALFGLAALMILAAALLRANLPAADGAETREQWEATNRAKCVVLWALIEGGVFISAVALYLGANPITSGALAAGGLGFLASQSPGTLAGH